jgi:hypothetical protein
MTRLFEILGEARLAFDASNDNLYATPNGLAWECPVLDLSMNASTALDLATIGARILGPLYRGSEVRSDSVVLYLRSDYED